MNQAAVPRPPGTEPPQKLSGVRHVVGVGAGKGGVGKSTVTVNLACVLLSLGKKVGVLDGDIYGPSLPTMLGTHQRPEPGPRGKLMPVTAHGVQTISVGYFMGLEEAVMWKGPMLAGALKQFLQDVDWGELDYLLVDLPPGTGDVQLTLAQTVLLSGAVLVSTPQLVALADVRRAKAMFEKLQVPVLGLVENMAYYVCTHCDKRHELFTGGGKHALHTELGVPLLGQLPLVQAVREGGDAGKPAVLSENQTAVITSYRALAQNLIRTLEH